MSSSSTTEKNDPVTPQVVEKDEYRVNEHESAENTPVLIPNTSRLLSVFWCLFVCGANDGAYGVLVPHLESYYNLSYTTVSFVFISPFIGYIASALLNTTLHNYTGQRGVALLSAACMIVAYVAVCLHPPFPVVAIAYLLVGLGIGMMDAAWNAFIGGLDKYLDQLLGILHAMYGLGATLSPLIATSLFTKRGWQWWEFYYLMIGAALIALLATTAAFWTNTAADYRRVQLPNPEESQSPDRVRSQQLLKQALLKKPAAPITWICAFFFFFYVSVEVAFGGWIVSFMEQVRHASPFVSGMTATGFWLGITVGRLLLGFLVTPFTGERIGVTVYLIASIACTVAMMLVHPGSYPASLPSPILPGLIGFALGPLFPAGISACSRILPKHLHVASIGFATAFGGTGGAVFPFITGAISQSVGVQALMPVAIGLQGGCLLTWLLLPGGWKRKFERRDINVDGSTPETK